MEISISQAELMRLCERWEPEASQTPIGFRKSKCVVCAEEMTEMFHCWLNYTDSHGTRWTKEVHLCLACGSKYAVGDPDSL